MGLGAAVGLGAAARSRSSHSVRPSQVQSCLGFWKSPAARATTPQANLEGGETNVGVSPHCHPPPPPQSPPNPTCCPTASPGPRVPRQLGQRMAAPAQVVLPRIHHHRAADDVPHLWGRGWKRGGRGEVRLWGTDQPPQTPSNPPKPPQTPPDPHLQPRVLHPERSSALGVSPHVAQVPGVLWGTSGSGGAPSCTPAPQDAPQHPKIFPAPLNIPQHPKVSQGTQTAPQHPQTAPQHPKCFPAPQSAPQHPQTAPRHSNCPPAPQNTPRLTRC